MKIDRLHRGQIRVVEIKFDGCRSTGDHWPMEVTISEQNAGAQAGVRHASLTIDSGDGQQARALALRALAAAWGFEITITPQVGVE